MDESRNSLPPNHNERDPLDDLLGQAWWAQPEPERIERLWHSWLRQQRTVTLQRWIPVAAAAGILLAWLVGLWFWRPAFVPVPGAESPRQLLVKKRIVEPRTTPRFEPRPPTRYEELVFRAAKRRRQAVLQQLAPVTEANPLEVALERLTVDEGASPQEVGLPLQQAAARYEWQLAEVIRQSAGPRRIAALRLLSQIGTPAALNVLYEFAQLPETRAAARPGLLRLASVSTLEQMARNESDPEFQKELLAALLQRHDRKAVVRFLDFVLSPEMSQASLDALALVNDPPVELLFGLLGSRHYPLRFAAARVLGRINGPVVSRRLAAMVVEDVQRREALIALLASSGKEAQAFLQQAERHPSLAAAVRVARSQFRAFFKMEV